VARSSALENGFFIDLKKEGQQQKTASDNSKPIYFNAFFRGLL
jgi:hypothetical protein